MRNAEEFYGGACLACIAAADRYSHIEQEIMPALSLGKVVISDRYVESSLVLQRLDGCALEFLWGLNSQILIPDLSVILIADPVVLNRRLADRKKLSRFEQNESRKKEMRFYREAAKFISQRGFNVLLLVNDVTPLKENADRIILEIQKLRQERRKNHEAKNCFRD